MHMKLLWSNNSNMKERGKMQSAHAGSPLTAFKDTLPPATAPIASKFSHQILLQWDFILALK